MLQCCLLCVQMSVRIWFLSDFDVIHDSEEWKCSTDMACNTLFRGCGNCHGIRQPDEYVEILCALPRSNSYTEQDLSL
jgi:hypothetical protein